MEVTRINEPIDVGAVFAKNTVRPKWFVWNNKKYDIKAVTYTWQDKKGEALLAYFSVSDGSNLYELCLNQKDLCWRLKNVSVE